MVRSRAKLIATQPLPNVIRLPSVFRLKGFALPESNFHAYFNSRLLSAVIGYTDNFFIEGHLNRCITDFTDRLGCHCATARNAIGWG